MVPTLLAALIIAVNHWFIDEPSVYAMDAQFAFYNNIDIVFTWVNGSDPVWQDKFITAKSKISASVNRKSFALRYVSQDEMKYAFRAIEANMPWFRKIFLVTADQVPNWINASHPQLEIVSHDQIMPSDSDRPSFNSAGIEFSLHRIANLSEHFLYFNDDFFVLRPLSPFFFFMKDGRPLFPCNSYIKYKNPRKTYDKMMAESDTQTIDRQSFFAKMMHTVAFLAEYFGVQQSGEYIHMPSPLTKSLLTEISVKFEQLLRPTIYSNFRKPDHYQFETMAMLYGKGTNQLVTVGRRIRHLHLRVTNQFKFLVLRFLPKNIIALCLNHVTEEYHDSVFNVLEHWWPHKSRMEL